MEGQWEGTCWELSLLLKFEPHWLQSIAGKSPQIPLGPIHPEPLILLGASGFHPDALLGESQFLSHCLINASLSEEGQQGEPGEQQDPSPTGPGVNPGAAASLLWGPGGPRFLGSGCEGLRAVPSLTALSLPTGCIYRTSAVIFGLSRHAALICSGCWHHPDPVVLFACPQPATSSSCVRCLSRREQPALQGALSPLPPLGGYSVAQHSFHKELE